MSAVASLIVPGWVLEAQDNWQWLLCSHRWMCVIDRLSWPKSVATSSIVRYDITSYQASYHPDNNCQLEFILFLVGISGRFHLSMFFARSMWHPLLLRDPYSIFSMFSLASASSLLPKDGHTQLGWEKRPNSGWHIIVLFGPRSHKGSGSWGWRWMLLYTRAVPWEFQPKKYAWW